MVPLGEVASFIRGITYKPADLVANFSEGSIVCMRTANVQATLDDSDVLSIPRSFVKDKAKILREGDLLVSTANSWNLVGKCCWVPELSYEATVGGFIAALRGDPEKIDPRYLYRWFSSPRTQANARNCGRQTTNISNMDLGRCLALKLRLPPLQEQRRIAAILDKADALRAKRREAIAKLNQLLQSVFLDMFGHPLANERSWPLVRIGDVCSPKQWPTITGKQLESSGYPVYGANGVIGFYSSFNHDVPTILVTCRGATCGTINVCEARSYVTGNAMALNNLDTAKVELDYMATMLRMRGVNEAITGAAQPQITRVKLSPVLIPLPPLSLQTRFARTSEAIAGRKAALQEHANGLDHLFSSIQHGAFAGTV